MRTAVRTALPFPADAGMTCGAPVCAARVQNTAHALLNPDYVLQQGDAVLVGVALACASAPYPLHPTTILPHARVFCSMHAMWCVRVLGSGVRGVWLGGLWGTLFGLPAPCSPPWPRCTTVPLLLTPRFVAGTLQAHNLAPEVSLKQLVCVMMMAGSTDFLTPIGYQTNMMVRPYGNYNFVDYTK